MKHFLHLLFVAIVLAGVVYLVFNAIGDQVGPYRPAEWVRPVA